MVGGSIPLLNPSRDSTDPTRAGADVVALDPPTTAPSLLARIDADIGFAYQPIVSMHTGSCYGYEALVQGHRTIGYADPAALLNAAHHLGVLHRADIVLRQKALEGFCALSGTSNTRLFFNLDVRVLDAEDYRPGITTALLARLNLDPSSVCFEIPERSLDTDMTKAETIRSRYREQLFQVAIDEFGSGAAGLKMLYEHQPDLVKINRYFIRHIERDDKKKLFVSSIVSLAHVLGVSVIAVGIETEREFMVCREIGCDLAQGYFIARPTRQVEHTATRYDSIASLSRRARRDRNTDRRLVHDELTQVPSIHVGCSMNEVFETFRQYKEQSFFPVVDNHDQPLGIVRETDLKDFIYSPYGKDLLSNKSYSRGLRYFLSHCPICDINTPAERILSIYALDQNPAGVLIVDDFRYAGVLSMNSLLRIINEKNLAIARDQSPLTRLPGNSSISDYVNSALDDTTSSWIFCYFDIDNFKPFNDTFGFRQGDRAILLFADLMRSRLAFKDTFLGHIGGDDFFAGFRNLQPAQAIETVEQLLTAFRDDMESFYDPESRVRGHIIARDRSGDMRPFPLLTCSSVILTVPEGERTHVTGDVLAARIAEMKLLAKQADNHLCIGSLQ